MASTNGLHERDGNRQPFSRRRESDDSGTVSQMRDGERLRAILTKYGKTPKQLEDALGKSRAMVHRYLTMASFSPTVRERLKEGLQALQIDAEELGGTHLAIVDPSELRGLLDGIPDECLPNVKRMMELTDRATRIGLIALIEDRIERSR